MNRTITDIKGNIHNIDLTKTSVTSFNKKLPHWGWWVLWLLLCWPIMFVLFFMGKRVATVCCNGVSITVSEATGVNLMNEIDTLRNSKSD